MFEMRLRRVECLRCGRGIVELVKKIEGRKKW